MNRPWMPFHTRDWLDNKELRRCSPLARSVLLDLMCLAHEGVPYGFLADKVGGLTLPYCASRCFVSKAEFARALGELQAHGRVQSSENGVIFIPRMVEDERVRLARAAGGVKGGNPKLMDAEVNGKVNLTPQPSTQPCGKLHSRARMRADSDSDSSCVSSERESEGKLFESSADSPGVVRPDVPTPPPAFDRFWSLYWNKTAKEEARRAWPQVAAAFGEEFLIEQVGTDHERWQNREEWSWRSRLHPATWLRGHRWEDQVSAITVMPRIARKEDFSTGVKRLAKERIEKYGQI